jgi:rhodanese-related sulfurtransferase
MTEPVKPHGVGAQTLLLIVFGALVGLGANGWQAADFSDVTEPVEAVSSGAVAQWVQGEAPEAATGPKVVTFETVMGELLGQPGVVFIDARDEGTFSSARMPGARHLDAEALEADPGYGASLLTELPQESVLVIYCGGGGCDLSIRLARILSERGWSRTLVYEGGWQEWTDMGGPIEEGAP